MCHVRVTCVLHACHMCVTGVLQVCYRYVTGVSAVAGVLKHVTCAHACLLVSCVCMYLVGDPYTTCREHKLCSLLLQVNFQNRKKQKPGLFMAPGSSDCNLNTALGGT